MKKRKSHFKPEELSAKVERAVALAHFYLRRDVLRLLKEAYSLEKRAQAKKVIFWILENSRKAESNKVAICQDTGMPMVFVEIGKNGFFDYTFAKAVTGGIERGYRNNYLRESAVEPLSREKAKDEQVIFHVGYSNRRLRTKITIFPKGFGSENKSNLKMFDPTVSMEEIEEFVAQSVKDAGPEGCPPFFVGVGIGGTSDTAMLMAKKALMQRMDKKSSDPVLRGIENRLYRKINSLKIGPMGMGGKFTCLAVKTLKFPTHIAGLPVGVNISCHALRSSSFLLD